MACDNENLSRFSINESSNSKISRNNVKVYFINNNKHTSYYFTIKAFDTKNTHY
jgi:hypothetical protein